MATVALVLRCFLSSAAITGDVSSTDKKTARPVANHGLLEDVAEVLRAIIFLFSNFISELVLYARNFNGFTVHNPWLVFEFQGSVKRRAMKQT